MELYRTVYDQDKYTSIYKELAFHLAHGGVLSQSSVRPESLFFPDEN